jgi:hypothetical protein
MFHGPDASRGSFFKKRPPGTKKPNLLMASKEKDRNLLMASKGFLDKKQETT